MTELFTTDVLIVGGGPAGASAAFQLARLGISVLIIDRSDFPRVKACGGGLTKKTVEILPYSVEGVTQRSFASLDIGNSTGNLTRINGKVPVCAMTVRAEFDHYCLQQALAAGAKFQRIATLSAINSQQDFVEAVTEDGVIRCKYLVGADGVNSTVRRLSGVFPDVWKGFAVEACVPVSKPGDYQMLFDFFRVPGGYGWVFPKGDHLNVGLYSIHPKVGLNKESLSDYIKLATGQQEYFGFASHHLGFGGERYKVNHGRVFLAGDAAGLADPILGEGIYHAVRSGQLVAAAIAEGRGDPGETSRRYDSLLRELRRDSAICSITARTFYSARRLGYWALSIPTTRFFLMKGFEKCMTMGEIIRGAAQLPFLNRRAVRSRVDLSNDPRNLHWVAEPQTPRAGR